MTTQTSYEGVSPFIAGLRSRCPRCGEGHLFSGFLTVADHCDSCGQSYDFADSGDGPAILIMFPVGTIVVLLWIITDMLFGLPVMVHLVLWMAATVILSLLFLRPFKGLLIAMQYAAHGGKKPPLNGGDA